MSKSIFILFVAAFIFLFCAFISIQIGSVDCSFKAPLYLFQNNLSESCQAILHLRILRVAGAMAVGAGLSLSGSVLQRLLRNPLADSFVLGLSSSGTCFAVVGMILLSALHYSVQSFHLASLALIGSFVALLFLLGARKLLKLNDDAFALPLLGLMVNSFSGAVLMFAVAFLAPQQLGEAYRWMVGAMRLLSAVEVSMLWLVLIISSALLIYFMPALNALSFGDEFANSLGFHSKKIRIYCFLMVAILAAFMVAAAGTVGFVGLIVPHFVRILVPQNARIEGVCSLFLGAALVSVSDLLARTLFLPAELPVGVFTALIGAPSLAIILFQKARTLRTV